MRVEPAPLAGLMIIRPDLRSDARGSFVEAWHGPRYGENGLPDRFVQCNLSRSARGVLRGLHLQHPNDQGKLVMVLEGAVFDVAVDVRQGSPTFARWFGLELSAGSGNQLYVPPGFAHGFLSLSERALVMYLTTTVYEPASEIVVRWNDQDIAVAWPEQPKALSPRDASAPSLSELRDRLPSMSQ